MLSLARPGVRPVRVVVRRLVEVPRLELDREDRLAIFGVPHSVRPMPDVMRRMMRSL